MFRKLTDGEMESVEHMVLRLLLGQAAGSNFISSHFLCAIFPMR